MASKKPDIKCAAVYPTIQVPHVRAAAEFYRDKLGFDVEFLWGEPPVHASVSLGSVAIHFSQGPPNPPGLWIALFVEDVDQLFAWYQSNGIELLDEPQTQPWGMREFNLRDLNGYQLRFGQPDYRSGIPLLVERVDLHARIEKRLAAVIRELAEHKGMSIGEMLEETLLHTFESMPNLEGQGVASPHTKSTLKYIDELRGKYGLDYHTHDSYRFHEQ